MTGSPQVLRGLGEVLVLVLSVLYSPIVSHFSSLAHHSQGSCSTPGGMLVYSCLLGVQEPFFIPGPLPLGASSVAGLEGHYAWGLRCASLSLLERMETLKRSHPSGAGPSE